MYKKLKETKLAYSKILNNKHLLIRCYLGHVYLVQYKYKFYLVSDQSYEWVYYLFLINFFIKMC